jgi:putative acetyltransferase
VGYNKAKLAVARKLAIKEEKSMKEIEIRIRSAIAEDALAIAKARYDAIQNVDNAYYDQFHLDKWAGPIGEESVQKLYLNGADVRIVAEINEYIVGYGELVTDKNRLGACYVSSSASRKGVGRTIVADLERIAREKGMTYLKIESSLNAEKFYVSMGYKIIERGKHTMSGGTVMDCVHMRKDF